MMKKVFVDPLVGILFVSSLLLGGCDAPHGHGDEGACSVSPPQFETLCNDRSVFVFVPGTGTLAPGECVAVCEVWDFDDAFEDFVFGLEVLFPAVVIVGETILIQ